MSTITGALAAATAILAAATITASTRLHRVHRRLQAAQQLAHTDELTGIGNRRAFTTTLHAAITTHPGHVAVVLVDLDRFKDINDTYGHPGGDLVLRAVADRLHHLDPHVQAVARLGGDEYALVVTGPPGTGLAVARLAWQAITGIPIRIGSRQVAVYACAGTASHTHGISGGQLLEQADLALYHAKHAGPVASYRPGTPADPPRQRSLPHRPPPPDHTPAHHEQTDPPRT
jgi:diguanylate cyclase (GGDEF)-like protein